MVSRILNSCSLYLGPEEDLTPGAPDNPDGYWENYRFVRINDAVLSEMQQGWDYIGQPPEEWQFLPSLESHRCEARRLVQSFEGHEPWGWKDPRNSLTLPFWQALIPSLKVVVCVRNPLEVALSLQKRSNSSFAFSFALWLAYYERLLSAVPASRRIVTHYESYFMDPHAELRRLTSALDLPAGASVINAASALRNESQRHHGRSTSELLGSRASTEVLNCYLELCAEAGPVYERVAQKNIAMLDEDFEGTHEVPFRAKVAGTQMMAWDRGHGHGWGNDPAIVFQLDEGRIVSAVRLNVGYRKQPEGKDTASLQAYWKRSGRQEFCEESSRTRKIPIDSSSHQITIPIMAYIDQLRLDPDVTSCEFEFWDMTLLVPGNGTAEGDAIAVNMRSHRQAG
jgi:hypothetical protein